MELTLNHIDINTFKPIQIYEYDPTRTLSLRNAFVADLNSRFRRLKHSIIQAVQKDDVFGLKKTRVTAFVSPGARAFEFASNPQKVDEFMNWLNKQVNDGLLEIKTLNQIGEATHEAWTNKYIYDSYKRGTLRARYELKKAGFKVPSMEETGGIGASMSTPFNIDRVGLLYIRAFNELKGITATMGTQISRVLAQGMADGDGASLLAKKMVAVIEGGGHTLGLTDTLGRFIPARRRAEIMARTEIIRAHHVANIQEYKNWGTKNVKVKAEWSTAGDTRVCSVCSGFEGNVYTLKVIENMIPYHPQCFIDYQIPIYTSKGWKKIGEIKVGNLVLTHKHRFRKVTALIRNKINKPDVVRFKFKGDLSLSMTENHPVLINYEWVNAIDCKVGMYARKFFEELYNNTGQYKTVALEIEKVEKYKAKHNLTTYNFSVEEDESYIAKGIVVHNCRCVALPVMNKEITNIGEQPVATIESEIANDPVASRFITQAHGEKYFKYFNDLSSKIKGDYFTSTEKKELINAFSNRNDSLLIKDATRIKLKALYKNSDTYQKILSKWTVSTLDEYPQTLRYLAKSLEKGLPEMCYKKGLFEENILNVIDTFFKGRTYANDEYIQWRAVNQALMKEFGPNEYTLYRGVNGETGERVYNYVNDLRLGNTTRTTVPMKDMPLIGYSDDFSNVAEDFGTFRMEIQEKGVVVIKQMLNRADIFTPTQLFAQLFNRGIFSEREFILLGKKEIYTLKDFLIGLKNGDNNWLWKKDFGTLRIKEY